MHWSEHYSEGDNFTQSVSLERWLGVVKTESDWWILAAIASPLYSVIYEHFVFTKVLFFPHGLLLSLLKVFFRSLPYFAYEFRMSNP
ncbi:hypothetical protein CEXT_425961 [Caerostris extrusa]|uniref:Uncharacterized protein n=1 Tax=Caerostris extrusa TaxID=172846 RepID=A0AAV4NUC2_CAEEX|nr:hypothetical protein CEXT_425961 [Caerostris extrusa]